MENKRRGLGFWFGIISGALGFFVNVIALIGFASGQLEFPNISLLSNPYMIGALTLSLLIYATAAIIYAFLEFSKAKVRGSYAQQSQNIVVRKGARSVAKLVWIPGYFIWVTATIIIIIPSADISNDALLSVMACVLLGVSAPFRAIFVPVIFGDWIVDLHYLISP